MKKIFNAFTIAEVIIVLGIIGIIVQIILPQLMSNIENNILDAQFKKYDAVLRDAFKKAAYDNGGSLAGYNLVGNIDQFFKLNKNCSLSSVDDYSCWHDDNVVKRINDDGSFYYKSSTQKNANAVILIDGAIMSFTDKQLQCDLGSENFPKTGVICITRNYKKGWCRNNYYIDINGFKGPNVYMQDVKEFWLWQDGYIKWYGTGSATNLDYIRYQDYRRRPNSDYLAGGVCEEYADWTVAGHLP